MTFDEWWELHGSKLALPNERLMARMAWQAATLAERESSGKDAARYRWIAEYLPSDRTDNDAIIVCENKQELDAVIDAAIRARSEKGEGRRMMWCWHKWGRWSEVIESYGGSLHQVCECTKCGAVKRRMAISILAAQLSALMINKALTAVRGNTN